MCGTLVWRAPAAARIALTYMTLHALVTPVSESQVRVKGASNFGTHANRLEQPREGSFGSLETDF